MYRKRRGVDFIKKRILFLFAVLIVLTFIFIDKYDEKLTLPIKTTLKEYSITLFSPTQVAYDYFNKIIDWYKNIDNLREENITLKENIEKQKLELLELSLLRQENKKLKEQLNIPEPFGYHFLTARIKSFGGTAFNKSLVIEAGKKHGLEENQAVLSPNGLVGRVYEVGEKYSTVLMVQDVNSRIPVVINTKGVKMICAGDNSNKLQLLYAGRDINKIEIGDIVETSGDAGILPPGIIVGKVSAIYDDVAVIKTEFSYNYLGIVSVLQKNR